MNQRAATDIPNFKMVDLFAGIGGMRLGFESVGGQCVFTSEWDKFAVQTYKANFLEDEESEDHIFEGDITKVAPRDVPDHDLLLAGFPCQPFSLAGVSKKNYLGKPHGFDDQTQGTLFFNIKEILKAKGPKCFLLENVKNLLSHDGGKTFEVIEETLEKLGYWVEWSVVDARSWVPQKRKRILIAGFNKKYFKEKPPFGFEDVGKPDWDKTLKEILHPEDGSEEKQLPYTTGQNAKVNRKYILTKKVWRCLQDHAAKHKKAENGFGYGLVDANGVARTLSARYHKDGSEILIYRGKGSHRPRRLTPRECARLMGFPEDFIIPVSDTQAYRQFGNSIVVPMVEEVAQYMKPWIMELGERDMKSEMS
jgi:DNA (cytosine-5)-methyltransferase 1